MGQGGDDVDRGDPGVGERAAQDRPVQQAGQRDVVDEGALAEDEARILLAGERPVWPVVVLTGTGGHSRSPLAALAASSWPLPSAAACRAAQRIERTMFS